MAPGLRAFVRDFLVKKGIDARGAVSRPVPPDGSSRSFWRVSVPGTDTGMIVMENPPRDPFARRENLAYLRIGRHLFSKGVPLPEILHCDPEAGRFILTDLGEQNLQEAVSAGGDPLLLYEKVLEHLLRMQVRGSRGFDPAWCCQSARYDRTVMRRYESDYFRDAFLHGYLGLKASWPELEAPFDHLAATAALAGCRFFMHRDFQSRNIMVRNGEIGIIDWQGGRLGPPGYDVASLYVDPYPPLRPDHREEIPRRYLRLLKACDKDAAAAFERYFPYLSVQRSLQILGAFSHLTRVKRKPRFEAYILPSLRRLRDLLERIHDPGLHALRNLVRDLPR